VILFRCNAGPDVGFGHLMRCRALARALSERGEACIMVGPANNYAKDGDNEVFREWIEIGEWRSSGEDARQLLSLAREWGAKAAVLDDYRVDEEYQLLLWKHGLRWLQFDGAARIPIWAEWILNSSPTARTEDYQKVKRNPQAIELLGPRYAILRAEFQQIETRSCDRSLQRVLITFGGGDDRGAIEFVLSSLVNRTESPIDFLVVSGKGNPRNADLIHWVETNCGDRVTIEIDPPDVARLFASCDLAIMGSGSSVFEVACCQVPMILIAISDNQIRHGAAWGESGAAIFLGDIDNTDEASLLRSFNLLYASGQTRVAFCATARSMCDGMGATRVADVILNITKQSGVSWNTSN
jgi:UDP-2,4-diacetamido-2,4,6-trideoxy-beta-L-altropyranose hydrolase